MFPQQSAVTEKHEPGTLSIVCKTHHISNDIQLQTTWQQVCNLDTIAAALVSYWRITTQHHHS
jgi:hypothetical protein